MTVAVSRPPPRSRVYFSRAPGATEVFSLPVFGSPCQPEETLPPFSPPQHGGPVDAAALRLLLDGRGRLDGGRLNVRLAAQEGGQSSASAQQHRQQQKNQLHAASAPGSGAPGAGALSPSTAVRVSAGVAYRAGAKAFAALLYGFSGAGHMSLPASGAIVLH